MNEVLAAWNALSEDTALVPLLDCCAAQRWAKIVVSSRPYATPDALAVACDQVWATMQEADWLEAFRAHPRIGERKAKSASLQSTTWSREEQLAADGAHESTLATLATDNQRYEESFGFTYIVCATGKNAVEMLDILHRRLRNNRQSELEEAAEQQRLIMHIRLKKWLQP